MLEPAIRPIKIAILAMGGEGGGVLADWIVSASEQNGYSAQSTSVPGVAQRTGSTIYYVEVFPLPRSQGRQPVFALMPLPGDVDLVIASEMMEAGRAIQRGLVTTDRTVLIASSNRVYTMPEKMAMGDGRVNVGEFLSSALESSKHFVHRDFAKLAETNGSVISASLFGAVAASGVLPLSKDAFEDAIKIGGVGVEGSLKAFAAGYAAYLNDSEATTTAPNQAAPVLDPRLASEWKRVQAEFPEQVWMIVRAGVARTADYQGPQYARMYLHLLQEVLASEQSTGDGSHRLLLETARYLALWMTYEDVPRVAELKIRQTRLDRVYRDSTATKEQLVQVNEYFHPRLEEIADTAPARLGHWILHSRMARAALRPMTRKGRVIRTSTLGGYVMLYATSMLRSLRPYSLRYERESRHIREWLALVAKTAAHDYALACELAECPRLVKGYGDTHARGMRHYSMILESLTALRNDDAAAAVRQLREAALADESGERLESLLQQCMVAPSWMGHAISEIS